MNKLSIVLLAATVFAVNTQANYGWKHRGNGHNYFETRKEEWNDAIDALKNKQEKADAKKLLTKIEKQHNAMVKKFDKIKEMRQEKHKNMDKLDKMLGLPTTKERMKTKVAKIKNEVQNKIENIKSAMKDELKNPETRAQVKNKIEDIKTKVNEKLDQLEEKMTYKPIYDAPVKVAK
jgi:hypothetical protein